MSVSTLDQYVQDTVEMLQELTSDWDTDVEGQITPATSIVQDLGF